MKDPGAEGRGGMPGAGLLASLLIVPGFIAATLALTWPLVRNIGRALPTVIPHPDALLQAFILNWDLRMLATRPFGVFDIPIFYPERNVLTYMDHLLGEAVVSAPAMALTHNTAIAYNSVVLFSFVASAWAAYRLVRLLGVSRGGGFVCGLLFAFGPYRYCNIVSLNLLQTEFLPLGLLFAFRAARKGRACDLAAVGVVLAAQSYFSWYYTFYLGTALVLFALYRAAGGSLRARDVVSGRALAVAGATVLLLLPGLVPYLVQRSTMKGFGRSLGMTSLWSADLFDYLKINVENRVMGGVSWLSGGQSYFPGLVAVVLAALGIAAARRSWRDVALGSAGAAVTGDAVPGMGLAATPAARGAWRAVIDPFARFARRFGDGGYFMVLGAVAFVLSLGPVLKVAGHRLWVPLPYGALFFTVPGFASMRASGRFAVLVLLATVALAGLGYEWWWRRLGPRGGGAALFAGTVAVTLALTYSVPLQMTPFPRADEMPAIYRWLERVPDAPPVLDLPMPAREQDEGEREVTHQIYAIYHHKPLVDGVSGFVSPSHRAFRTLMQSFPSDTAVRAAAERGTRIVIVHYGDLPAARRADLHREVERSPALVPIVTLGEDAAYSIDLGRKRDGP